MDIEQDYSYLTVTPAPDHAVLVVHDTAFNHLYRVIYDTVTGGIVRCTCSPWGECAHMRAARQWVTGQRGGPI